MSGTAQDGALEGLGPPAAAIEQAILSNRLHHAWLLAGPEGVGKAALAQRAAHRLLGAKPAWDAGPLGYASDDPVARLIAANAHPDLLVLERRIEDGKLKKGISVEDARRLPEFFAKTPAIARYRVAVIDSADDLNTSAANALLKTLEEPSGRGVLLLVSHAPGRLLPTMRSRCRLLRFTSWSESALTDFVQRRLELDGEEANRLARLAQGAPGRALALHAAGGLELDEAVRKAVGALPNWGEGARKLLADPFRGAEGAARFALTMELLGANVAETARSLAGSAASDLWAEAWRRLDARLPQVEGLNLDRADALGVTLSELAEAARAQAAPC